MPSRTSSFRLAEMLLAPPPWTTTTTSMEARRQEEASVISNRFKRTDPSKQQSHSGFRPSSLAQLLGGNFVGKAQSDPYLPAFLPMLSPSDPRGRYWGICGSECRVSGCQDSEPALEPQRYPSASVSPENTSLYFVASTEDARIRVPALLPGVSLCASVSRGPCSLFQFPPPRVRGILRTGRPHVLRT